MAENIPPTANGSTADTARGVPYYEKLKRDLRETITKKRMLDKSMTSVEEQIFRLEGQYLEETSAGNIIKGFDNYIKGSTGTGGMTGTGGGGGGGSVRRKGTLAEHDRVFSRSSASFMRLRESSPSSTTTTPSHAPTPTASQSATNARDSGASTPAGSGTTKAATNKKKQKAQDKEEEEGDKPPKRLKITYKADRSGE